MLEKNVNDSFNNKKVEIDAASLSKVVAGASETKPVKNEKYHCKVHNKDYSSSDGKPYECDQYKTKMHGCYMYKDYRRGCHNCKFAEKQK